MGLRYNMLVPPTGWLLTPSQSLYGRRFVVRLRRNLIFLIWIDYQIFSEMCELLVCIVPVRPLLSSMADVYHVNG